MSSQYNYDTCFCATQSISEGPPGTLPGTPHHVILSKLGKLSLCREGFWVLFGLGPIWFLLWTVCWCGFRYLPYVTLYWYC